MAAVFPTEMTRGFTETRDAADIPIDDPMYVPARQYGGEEEMGGTILYLASRAGAYCNGLVLVSRTYPVLDHDFLVYAYPYR